MLLLYHQNRQKKRTQKERNKWTTPVSVYHAPRKHLLWALRLEEQSETSQQRKTTMYKVCFNVSIGNYCNTNIANLSSRNQAKRKRKKNQNTKELLLQTPLAFY